MELVTASGDLVDISRDDDPELMDALTVGNMLYWGDCTSTVMNVSDVPRFAASSITVTED
jgi:hypothetical protein